MVACQLSSDLWIFLPGLSTSLVSGRISPILPDKRARPQSYRRRSNNSLYLHDETANGAYTFFPPGVFTVSLVSGDNYLLHLDVQSVILSNTTGVYSMSETVTVGVQISSVPEPSTFAFLAGAGAIAAGLKLRRKR